MALLVTMQVSPVDWGKFKAACEWAATKEQKGRRSERIFRAEGDPKSVLVVQEWDSHDAFHAASDELGDEFNRRAGTEGLDWITGTWVLSDAPAL